MSKSGKNIGIVKVVEQIAAGPDSGDLVASPRAMQTAGSRVT